MSRTNRIFCFWEWLWKPKKVGSSRIKHIVTIWYKTFIISSIIKKMSDKRKSPIRKMLYLLDPPKTSFSSKMCYFRFPKTKNKSTNKPTNSHVFQRVFTALDIFSSRLKVLTAIVVILQVEIFDSKISFHIRLYLMRIQDQGFSRLIFFETSYLLYPSILLSIIWDHPFFECFCCKWDDSTWL